MRRALAALLATGALVVACRPEPEPTFDGWWLVGDAAALGAELDRLQGFAETPAAAWAASARARLDGCERVVAFAEAPHDLADAIRCFDPAAMPVEGPLDDALSAAAGLDRLAWAVGGPLAGARIRAHAVVHDDRTSIDIEITGQPDGPSAALLPRAADVGTPRFGGPLLVHGRFGADGGLDLASWVEEGSAGDRLFGLRSRLFSGALLTGVWEVAVPSPVEGEAMLPVVLAIETRSRTAASAAVDAFVAELGRSWGLLPTPTRLGDLDGACFGDLNVLPAFRPCWVLVDDALVVGWNASALERALRPDDGPNGDQPSRLVVHLDRFPEADAILARAVDASSDALPGPYPWRRWTVEGRREGDVYRVGVVLDAAE